MRVVEIEGSRYYHGSEVAEHLRWSTRRVFSNFDCITDPAVVERVKSGVPPRPGRPVKFAVRAESFESYEHSTRARMTDPEWQQRNDFLENTRAEMEDLLERRSEVIGTLREEVAKKSEEIASLQRELGEALRVEDRIRERLRLVGLDPGSLLD